MQFLRGFVFSLHNLVISYPIWIRWHACSLAQRPLLAPAGAALCRRTGGRHPAAGFPPVHLSFAAESGSDVPQTFCSPCLSGYAAAGVNLRGALRLLPPFSFPAFVVLFQDAQESVSPGITGN